MLMLLLCTMLPAVAQSSDTFQFVDKNGQAVASGATVIVSDLTEDPFGAQYINSGLKVKNTSAEEASVRMVCEIQSIDNGDFQLCFPLNCMRKSAPGTFTTESGSLNANEISNLQCEWFPTAYGSCKAKLSLEVLNALGTKTADGPSITLVFNHAAPAADQLWWGYFNESDFNIQDITLGIGTPTPFLTAIAIPANHEQLGNATVSAVRIYLAQGIPASVKELKVWVSKSLPASVDAADYVQTVTGTLVEGANDIELTTPYVVNNEAFYIGYYINSTESYCIRCGGSDQNNAFLICAPQYIDWSDLAGNGFGKLAFQVRVSGAVLKDNSVSLTVDNLGNAYGAVDKTAELETLITNNGRNDVSNIDYVIDGGTSTFLEYHLNLPSPIAYGESAKVTFAIPTDKTASVKNKEIVISKVNGVANESSANKAQFTLYSLSRFIDRNVLVEEFTGTGCGYCPRGLVGMEKMRKAFGDRFVGVGIHRYNASDAMYIANYAPVNFSGAPSCRIDRGEEIDPYFGSGDDVCDDMRAAMAIPGFADVDVSGTLDEAYTAVSATATVSPLFADTYNVEFVLVADGLQGTGSAWNQANYYYQYSAAQMPEDLSIFGNGGKYGKASVTGWIFNDVAIASSFVNNTNKVASKALNAEENAEFTYTISLPTKEALKAALKKDEIYVVAIVTDSKKNVVNAVKKKVSNATPSAVKGLADDGAVVTARYTTDGRRIMTPQKGLNIIKMADGRTRKVVVK